MRVQNVAIYSSRIAMVLSNTLISISSNQIYYLLYISMADYKLSHQLRLYRTLTKSFTSTTALINSYTIRRFSLPVNLYLHREPLVKDSNIRSIQLLFRTHCQSIAGKSFFI